MDDTLSAVVENARSYVPKTLRHGCKINCAVPERQFGGLRHDPKQRAVRIARRASALFSVLYRSFTHTAHVPHFCRFRLVGKTQRATHTTRALGTDVLSLAAIDLMVSIESGLSSKYFSGNDFYGGTPKGSIGLDRSRGKEARENCYKHHYAPNKKAYGG